ncbi:unnamed protein product [Parajaminaea phylloscopi]
MASIRHARLCASTTRLRTGSCYVRYASSFDVSSVPSTSSSREVRAKPGQRPPQGTHRPRWDRDVNRAVHEVLTGLQSADLEKAWAARQALCAQGYGDRLSVRDLRDLRKLLFRYYQGVKPSKVSKEELLGRMREMADAAVRKAAQRDTHGAEFLQWVVRFLGEGKDDEAMRLLHSYFDQAKLHERTANPSEGSVKGKGRQQDEVEADIETVFETAVTDSVPEGRLDPVPAPAEASSRDASWPRLLPPFIARALMLLVYTHIAVHGDISRIIPLLRTLPLPARQNVYLASDANALEVYQFPTRNNTPEHAQALQEKTQASLPALRFAELAWGLDRPESEVGTNPLGRLFASLFSKRDAHSLSQARALCDALLMGTAGGSQALFWVAELEKPVDGPSFVAGPGPSEHARTTRPDVTDSTWAVLLRGFVSVKDLATSGKVWAHLRSLGVAPGSHIYNGLLSGYAASGQWESMKAVWLQLKEDLASKGGPDIISFATMINGLFKSGDADEALAVFEDLCVQEANRPKPQQISTETYNSVVFGLLVAGRTERAMSILESMISAASPSSEARTSDQLVPPPTTATWNILLRAHARTGNFAALAQTVVQARTVSDFQPDVISFVTILDGIIRFGSRSTGARDGKQVQKQMRELVDRVLGLMHQSGVQMNTVAWTTVIKGVLASGNVSAVSDEADEDFEYASPRSRVNVQRLGADSSSFVVGKNAIEVKLQQISAGLALLRHMTAKGISPNQVTYTALMQSAIELHRLCEEYPEAAGHVISEIGESDAMVRTVLEHLEPISELREQQATMDALRQEQFGQALALALFAQMRGKSTASHRQPQLAPNRKTYHVLLASLLRSFPAFTPSAASESSGGGPTNSARAAFVRGLALLDEFTYRPLGDAEAAGAGGYPEPGLLTPLSPPAATRSHDAVVVEQQTDPNDTSYRIILDALHARHDHLTHAAATTTTTSIGGEETAGSQRLNRELQLTRMVTQNVLDRVALAERASRARGAPRGGGSSSRMSQGPSSPSSPSRPVSSGTDLRVSPSLDRMRQRARQLLDS